MKTAGIICEFNPFSEGHEYLIDSVRRSLNPDAVVCVMSGNFVQRGLPAIEDKYKRAEDAVNCGADLVLQMPVCVSLSSAKYFAQGAVNIINDLNTDFLCFGSESGDLGYLKGLAENGIESLEEGNNILAAEYLRNISKNITPWTLEINKDLGHASDKRKNINADWMENLFILCKYNIVSKSLGELRLAPEVSEGLEFKLKEAVQKANSFDELVKAIKSKRYNYTRICRMLMQIILGIERSYTNLNYAYILAFNDIGKKLIKESKCRLISNLNPSDALENPDIALDVKADDIYSVLCNKEIYSNSDYVCRPCKSNI